MTHDLLVKVLEVLEAQLLRVIIDKLVNNTFYAKLEIKSKDGQVKMIDSRPSDSIAMAVRFKAPIFVADDVFQKSSLTQP
jgi:bifunctional DNase/RNase